MRKSVENKIEEAYNHIKPYIKYSGELKSMCSNCEKYCGDEHDYSECRNLNCFKFYLSYVYLNWEDSSDGY